MPRFSLLLDAGPHPGPQRGKLRLPLADPCRGPHPKHLTDPPKVLLLGGAGAAAAEVSAHIFRLAGRESPVDEVLDHLSRLPAFHPFTPRGSL
jgi:hypothetical protein